ncbi:MAG: tyrosine--tRNA ligase [Myxococcales bacterium]|nr:tyrosine--tRNA ligase [Myxococcales bacterium]MDD9964939.1 tyrosine--tRNA ligase [Myxococcales bacterium]
MTIDFLAELKWRGLLHQTTSTEELVAHLAAPGRLGYAGFDPTRDSLTIGNLIPIMLLKHWQRAGHRPIVLMGGGTGLIGDPSGKDAERQLMTEDRVQRNVDAQVTIMRRLLDFEGERGAMLVNNADWLNTLGYIEVLRGIGKHFSINAMIQKDSVRDRLHNREQGISYTEFSYMLLQAYDFLHLRRELGCTVQFAGSDQFGNIVAGIDLIRREFGRGDAGQVEAFGITAPLVTKADGKKIGKSEKGAIWLDADNTSPYAFYQFWLNVDDADVENFIKWYTLLSEAEVTELVQAHREAPHARMAQRRLAQEVTRMVHGDGELAQVEHASQALFGGSIRELSEDLLRQVFADVPHSEHARGALAGDGVALVELLPQTTLASSKREARQFLTAGAVSVNGEKVAEARRVTETDLLHGHTVLLRRGKKLWHAARFG